MEHIEHLIEAYRDGELSPKRRRQVQEHLAVCAGCRAELEQLERLSSTLRAYALPDTVPSAEAFRAQVALRVARQPARAPRVDWWWYVVPLSLVTVVIVLLGLLALSGWVRALQPLLASAGVDLGSLLPAPSVAQLPAEVVSWLDAVSGPLWSVALYVALLLVYGSYMGWVSVLWRVESQPFSRKEG
ncbi:MAG: zf-HC2 domain-containing protein [Anaerolineae bacterium]|nr:zf-HC2 domain-containing protein [Anaerolineae bacterium]